MCVEGEGKKKLKFSTIFNANKKTQKLRASVIIFIRVT